MFFPTLPLIRVHSTTLALNGRTPRHVQDKKGQAWWSWLDTCAITEYRLNDAVFWRGGKASSSLGIWAATSLIAAER